MNGLIIRTFAFVIIGFTAAAFVFTNVSASSFFENLSPKAFVAFFAAAKTAEESYPQGALAPCVAGEKTWDGEGATNNWSEAANWTCDAVPANSDLIIFNATSTKNSVIDQSRTINRLRIEVGYTGSVSQGAAADVLFTQVGNFGSFSIADGTFECSAAHLTFEAVTFSQTGGVFNCAAGSDVRFDVGTRSITGGTFAAPSGTMTIRGGNFDVSNAVTFNHSSGTIEFQGYGGVFGTSEQVTINIGGASAGNLGLYNAIFNNDRTSGSTLLSSGDTLTTSGTANFINGDVDESAFNNNANIDAQGPVVIASTYGNASAANGTGRVNLRLSGETTRIVTIPSDLGSSFNPIVLNAANTTVTTSGAGVAKVMSLQLSAGTFNTGNVAEFFLDPALGSSASTQNSQSGGTFVCGSGKFTLFRSVYTMTGGTFDCGEASEYVSQLARINLNGGTFTAPAGTLRLNGITTNGSGQSLEINGGTFLHNNGSVIFDQGFVSGASSCCSGLNVNGTNAGTVELFNADFNNSGTNQVTLLGGLDTIRVLGTLNMSRGFIRPVGSSASPILEAHGNVNVAPTFNSTTGFPEARIIFAGGGDQTFTNLGGPNLTSPWTISKTAGRVIAATPIVLGSTTTLSITGGTLYLNPGSDLTVGTTNITSVPALSIGSGGRLVSDSSATISLGGNLTNSGLVDLQGGGGACPENDTILIRSTNGAQRTWNGSGVFRLVDVDVQDMGGTGTKNVYSGTNSGNNNATWVFNSGCATALSISPAVANLQTGTTQTFTAGGGFAPYTFSVATNNSGSSIDAATGIYTAGNTSGTTDTIRVTDAFGATADATVSVFVPPSRLAFTVQPVGASAGQTLSPAIQVAVQDASGNTVLNSNAPISLTLLANNGAMLSGTTTKNAVNGVATFDDLSIARSFIDLGYRLQATSGSLIPATSQFFLVVPGQASRLEFITQPNSTVSNATLTPAVQVAVTDPSGNIIQTATNPITLALGNNPSDGTLSGTLTRNAVNGVATFSDLSIDNLGAGYTITASSANVNSAASDAFNIVPILVTNTNDSGAGSLRQAILDSNIILGRQRITFDIPGTAPFKIAPLSVLPSIIDPADIDATTQPGYAGTPLIELSGENISTAHNGLEVFAYDTVIKGFAINRWSLSGIHTISNNVTIADNFIGCDVSGTSALPNGKGVFFTGNNTTISGNLISGNSLDGVWLRLNNASTANLSSIIRNKIGTQIDGVNALPNGGNGILIQPLNVPVRSFPIILKIGGEVTDSNIIAFNAASGGAGISHRAPLVTAQIRRNNISDNGLATARRGIQLNGSNRTANNDSRDPDVGPNGLQNYPVITRVVSENGVTVITGTLNSKPNTSYGIDFFVRETCVSGAGTNGGTYFDSTSAVVTNASGFASFALISNQPAQIGRRITATAWAEDALMATSEYMPCSSSFSFSPRGTLITGRRFTIGGQVVDHNNAPIPFARVFIANSGISTVTDANGLYSFPDLPAGFDYTIEFSAPNYVPQPTNRTVTNLQADQLSENFAATRVSNISGQVVSVSNGSTFPLSNTNITVTGVGSVTTDVNGRYRVNSLLPATYTVNAAKTNFAFTPATVNTTVNGDQVVNFVGEIFNENSLRGRILSASATLPVMNADGSGAMQIYPPIGAAPAFQGQMSSDGQKIVFTRISAGNQYLSPTKLRIANFDGTGEVSISEPINNSPLFAESDPTWSNDLSKIAYIRSGFGPTSLKLVNPDGTGHVAIYTPTITTTGTRGLAEPDFSPDGSKIVFVTNKLNTSEITMINSNGSGVVTLTTENKDVNPRISPDGTKILFIRQTGRTGAGRIFTMDLSGQNLTEIPTPETDKTEAAVWSLDGSIIFFKEATSFKAMLANGSSPLTVSPATFSGSLTWAPTPSSTVASGSNVAASVGPVGISFTNVNSQGVVSVTQIPVASAGTMPAGFAIANQAGNVGMAYEISTTSNVTPPITVCFTVLGNPDPGSFNRYSVLHSEGGILVDRTVSRDFATRQICAETTSLSPFVLAEQIDTGLPSITGIAVDASGNPMAGVSVELTGTEDRATATDSDGRFAFVNLTPNGNYNVSPKQLGVLFDQYNQDFVNVTEEETVVFTGAAQNFAISGTLTDSNGAPLANTNVILSGSANGETTTDASGNYTFASLPADGLYTIQPLSALGIFAPESQEVSPLTGDASGVDFSINLTPTASDASISGRVTTADGRGIRNAIIEISGGNLPSPRRVLTGSFGYYQFNDLPSGEVYVLTISSKRYIFQNPTRVIDLIEDLSDADFVAQPDDIGFGTKPKHMK